MDEDLVFELDKAITEARKREVGVVAVHGAPDVRSAVVDAWIKECGPHYDRCFHVDLSTYREHRGVDLRKALTDLICPLAWYWKWGWPTPKGIGALARAYRRRVSRRQVLMCVANADQAAQARGFIGGGPGSLVIVTSRWRLGGLITEKATFVDLRPEHERNAER